MRTKEDDSYLSFQREVRANQMTTDALVFLKTSTEINFLKFILYRKIFRFHRGWETGYIDVENKEFDPKKLDELKESIHLVLIELGKWVDILKSVHCIKPRDDFFDDIYQIKDDLDFNDLKIDTAYDQLLEVTKEYKIIIENGGL